MGKLLLRAGGGLRRSGRESERGESDRIARREIVRDRGRR